MVIAESNANDPATIRPEADGGRGCDAQWADDFHHSLRTLLTGERAGLLRRLRPRRRPRQGLRSPLRLRRRLLGRRASAGSARPAGDRAPWPVRRLLAEPRPGRQPRARRPHAARGAPAGGALHAARAVHADALHGRGVRRGSALPVLHRPHREEDRRSDPQRAAQGVRSLRRVRRRSARPAGPGDLRALEALAPRGPGDRGALPPALRAARRAGAAPGRGRGRGGRVRRGGALALAAPRPATRSSATSPTASSGSPARRREIVLATHGEAATEADGETVRLPALAGAVLR